MPSGDLFCITLSRQGIQRRINGFSSLCTCSMSVPELPGGCFQTSGGLCPAHRKIGRCGQRRLKQGAFLQEIEGIVLSVRLASLLPYPAEPWPWHCPTSRLMLLTLVHALRLGQRLPSS